MKAHTWKKVFVRAHVLYTTTIIIIISFNAIIPISAILSALITLFFSFLLRAIRRVLRLGATLISCVG